MSRLFCLAACGAQPILERNIEMKYPKSEKIDAGFMKENMMGPNCVKMLEEMAEELELKPGMRVLDLGCGKGLTSVFLAKEFGVTVYATDLWITATENARRFQALGLEDRVIPIHADANALPYADGFFDAAVTVDAYLYFGEMESYMDRCLAPLVRPGGSIAVAIPGLKEDLEAPPAELKPFLSAEDFIPFHSLRWWQDCLKSSRLFRPERVWDFTGYDEAWSDWLSCDGNPYAVRDRDMIRADGGKYLNLICAVGIRI
jgi:cyclopropane fatty-acyl-phospholipid synthase-like methyltransferase